MSASGAFVEAEQKLLELHSDDEEKQQSKKMKKRKAKGQQMEKDENDVEKEQPTKCEHEKQKKRKKKEQRTESKGAFLSCWYKIGNTLYTCRDKRVESAQYGISGR